MNLHVVWWVSFVCSGVLAQFLVLIPVSLFVLIRFGLMLWVCYCLIGWWFYAGFGLAVGLSLVFAT